MVGYRITWPDGTTTPSGPNEALLTRVQAQVALRRGTGGSAKAVERRTIAR